MKQCGEQFTVVGSEGRGLLQITVIVVLLHNSSHPKNLTTESSVALIN